MSSSAHKTSILSHGPKKNKKNNHPKTLQRKPNPATKDLGQKEDARNLSGGFARRKNGETGLGVSFAQLKKRGEKGGLS